MKIVLAGATGQLGKILLRHFARNGDECIVLTRRPDATSRYGVFWDGRSPGPWMNAIDGADVVVNLAGRSVNCRYTERNLSEMMASRVESTRILGTAIAAARRPPRVWMQMSTATIYAHRHDAPNDEFSGIIGGSEPGVPRYWKRSIEIATAWEAALEEAPTPLTRKIALRAAMVMSPDRGGVFDTLASLARRGLGGASGDGRQFVSWIHEADFAAAISFLLGRDDISGPVNLAAPEPMPNTEFQHVLRHAVGARLALPAPSWLLEIGAWFLRTDTELILKSRRVIPARLVEAGYVFQFPSWPEAAHDLSRRWGRRSEELNHEDTKARRPIPPN